MPGKTKTPKNHRMPTSRLFQLLLGTQLVGVSALSLSAVGSTRRETSLEGRVPLVMGHHGRPRKTYVALAADHLLAVELAGQGLQRRLDDTTTETENKVKSRLLL
jgi:hypothetical protein